MDFKLAISIYAAVVSTIVFIWRIYEFYYDRSGKLKVTFKKITSIPVSAGYQFGDSEMFLVTTITNVGKNRRLIESPIYKSDVKVDGKEYFNFLSFTIQTKFPHVLEPGEKLDYKIPLKSLEESFKNKNVKIKAVIKDTIGKNYYSKWFEL